MDYTTIPRVSIEIALPHDLLHADTELPGAGIFSFFDLSDEAYATLPCASECRVAVFRTWQDLQVVKDVLLCDSVTSAPLAFVTDQIQKSQETEFTENPFVLALNSSREQDSIQKCFFEALKYHYDQGKKNLIVGINCFDSIAGIYRSAIALSVLIDRWGNMLQSLRVAIHPSSDYRSRKGVLSHLCTLQARQSYATFSQSIFARFRNSF